MIPLMENVKGITENDKKISFLIFFLFCVEVAPLEEQPSATTFSITIGG